MSAAATGIASQVVCRDDLAGGLYPRAVCGPPSHAGFGRVGCGLGGSADFSAGFRESDKLTGVNPRQASVRATLIGFQRTGHTDISHQPAQLSTHRHR
jgi:hypothetical protein